VDTAGGGRLIWLVGPSRTVYAAVEERVVFAVLCRAVRAVLSHSPCLEWLAVDCSRVAARRADT